MRDYDDVKDAIERNKKENWLFAGDVFSGHRGKFLQLELTIEDKGVFTTPWTSTLTYVPGPSTWPEVVCAENPHQYDYDGSDTSGPGRVANNAMKRPGHIFDLQVDHIAAAQFAVDG